MDGHERHSIEGWGTGSKVGAYRPGLSFDSAHLAQWGWTAAQAKSVVASNVQTYQPDYLLIALGFNDLAWGYGSPTQTIDNVKSMIDAARSANPSIRVVVSTVTQRSPLGNIPNLPATITSYNQGLAPKVVSWSTSASPVTLADVAGQWSYANHTYDGLHPNVRGEYVFAKTFADVLSTRFSLGAAFGAIPAKVMPEIRPWLRLPRPRRRRAALGSICLGRTCSEPVAIGTTPRT